MGKGEAALYVVAVAAAIVGVDFVFFRDRFWERPSANVLYVIAMAAIIVAVDFMFFRNRFWERLAANIGIVLVFLAFYWRFRAHP